MAKTSIQQNLFSSFIELSTRDGQPFADALRALNKVSGLSTTHSRFKQYERGETLPTALSINHMLSMVLKEKLTDCGLGAKDVSQVIKACQLPPKPKPPANKRSSGTRRRTKT
jgi:hypothetical protein